MKSHANTKRIIAFILTLILIIGISPAIATAENDFDPAEYLEENDQSSYIIDDETEIEFEDESDTDTEDNLDINLDDDTEYEQSDSIDESTLIDFDELTTSGDFGIQSSLPIISMGSNYSAVITANGDLYTWGSNEVGELGHGDYTDRSTPTRVVGLDNVVAVSLGGTHSAAITANGDLYTWGGNNSGQLGHGHTTNRSTPTRVSSLSNVIAVSLGSFHSAAITADGDLFTWGDNDKGQLGLGDSGWYTERDVPTIVTSLRNVVAVSLGSIHSAAITSDGNLHTWGYGSSSLGHGDYTDRSIPTRVTSLENVKTISIGTQHNAAITSDGNLHTWGTNYFGQLGLGDSGPGTERNVPTIVTSLRNVVAVSLGNLYSAAITSDGNLHTWGDNTSGQLGLGDSGPGTERNVPTRVPTLRNVVAVSLGTSYFAHSAAITSDGNLFTWGSNWCGQLGLGHMNDRLTPQRLRLEAGSFIIDNLPKLTSSTYDYNQNLAVICAELSAAAYDVSNIKTALEKNGFINVNTDSYSRNNDMLESKHHTTSHAFARRDVGNKRIVAVVIRGTPPTLNKEWLSNFDARYDSTSGNHHGFNLAMTRVLDDLLDYLGGTPINDRNTIYLITGHSRGAAIGNLLAAYLSSNELGVSNSNVFNYNFAVPDNTVGPVNGSKWNPGGKHNNIFNICNSEDVVAYVPGLWGHLTTWFGQTWGKYGRTTWFSRGIIDAHDMIFYTNFVINNKTAGSSINPRRSLLAIINWFKCPVDVQVYDSNDTLVAEIVNNELIYYNSSPENLMIMIDGDLKSIASLDGEEYRFAIIGTDTGTLNYSISSIDLVSQSIQVFKEFNDISLTDDKLMTSASGGDLDTPDVRLFVVDSSGNVLDEIEGEVRTPQPFGVSLDKSYIAMQAGQTTQLEAQITKPSPGAVDINWKSSNISVATVDSNGLVTAVGAGATVITAFNEGLGIAAECRIDVTQDDVGSTVESVRLLQSSVTTNVLSTNYTRVPLQLVLPQNRPVTTSTQSSSSSSSNIEHSITSVRLLNDPNNYFETRIVDDRFVELIPQNGIAGLTKITSLKTRLEVDIGDFTFTTSELTIRITRTLPKIRNNAIRFNSFFPDAPVNVIMTTSIGSISKVELLPEFDYQQVVFDSENMTLSLSSGRVGNPKRLVFNVSVDGFTNPIRHQVSTSVQSTRPAAKLNVTSVTMRQSAELQIIGQNVSDVEVVGNSAFTTTEIDSDGNFTLTYTDGDVVRSSTKLTLKVNFNGTDQSITRNITVRPPPAKLGIKLSLSTITLNKKVEDDSRSILITTTPVDATMSEIAITGDADRFEISEIGKQIVVGLNPDTPTGTYRILFGTARLTVKVVDANPAIRLSARGTFNIIDPNSTITLTPRFTNYNYTGSTPTINNDNFEIVSVSPSGVVTLRMSDNDLKPRTRQSITLTYDGLISAPINITPRQVKPRLLPSAKQITLQANDIHSEAQLDIAVQTPASARISRVEIQGNNANLYSIREIQNGSYSIGFKNQTISRGTNIRLNVFFEGSDLPVAVTLKVVVS